MEHRAVFRHVSFAAVVALGLLVAASPALAQVPQPPPGAGTGLTAPPPLEPSTSGIVEGSVKKVDPSSQTVQVSTGLFGILGRTLGVTKQTQIQVNGRHGTLSDIHEGKQVRASYEVRDGRNVASMIEVMPPADASSPSGASETRPPAPGAGMPSSNPSPGSSSGTKY